MSEEIKHESMENLSTKVNAEFKALFEGICQMLGLKPYNVMQLCAEAIVLMRDETHNMSDDMRRVIRMFEGINHAGERICLADSWDEMEIVAAIYFLRNRLKSGERPAMVEPFFGEMNATYNSNTILEKLLKVVSPSLYKNLVDIEVEMETNSIIDTIARLADLYRENPMEKEVLDMLSDTERMENGRKMASGPYRRTMNNDLEAWNRRQTSLDFGDPDDIIKEIY